MWYGKLRLEVPKLHETKNEIVESRMLKWAFSHPTSSNSQRNSPDDVCEIDLRKLLNI